MLINNIEVPPILTKGNVCPVTGNILTATATFIKAWNTKLKQHPIVKKVPKYLGVFVAIFIPLKSKIRYININTIPPISPYSSIIMAKIKSE